jgi:hypothetical protein
MTNFLEDKYISILPNTRPVEHFIEDILLKGISSTFKDINFLLINNNLLLVATNIPLPLLKCPLIIFSTISSSCNIVGNTASSLLINHFVVGSILLSVENEVDPSQIDQIANEFFKTICLLATLGLMDW